MSDKYIVSTKSEIFFLKIDDILYCQSENSYSTIFLEHKEFLVSKSLSKVEREISNNRFIRVSQSHIVNIRMIDHVDKKRKEIILLNGIRLPFTIKINSFLTGTI